MTTRNGKRNVTNRFGVVSCQACGRRAARKSRQRATRRSGSRLSKILARCSQRYEASPTMSKFNKPYDRTVHRLRDIERIGVPLATIDAQIRLIGLMTHRQMWSCRPGGAA